MKPIRIYASYDEQVTSNDYYVWRRKRVCQGGSGCLDDCVFHLDSSPVCGALDSMDTIVQTYQPDSGYVELTIDSHPEVFL